MARIRRKRYSDAFKLEAVRLVQTSERPLTEFAEHLGVTATTLHAWVRQHRPPAPERLTGDERRELEQLRRENARLRMERDILKKPGPSSRARRKSAVSIHRRGEGQGSDSTDVSDPRRVAERV